jgi:tyrosine-protein phosphatase YwqE
MFNLFKKKDPQPTQPAYAPLHTDMHSHLLPGIDDGSPNVETSLRLMDGLIKLGYRKFICTPHIYKELYPNTPETIKAAYDELWPAVQERFPGIELDYAAEYFLDENFDELLSSGQKLLTISDQYILVEYSFSAPPLDLKEKLYNLQLEGYKPILAHPERYGYYAKMKHEYDALFDAGCVFQLNILSLCGYYGKQPTQLAEYLVGKKYITLLGTDIHHARHLNALQSGSLQKTMRQLQAHLSLLNPSL